jgi:hypothetical protein
MLVNSNRKLYVNIDAPSLSMKRQFGKVSIPATIPTCPSLSKTPTIFQYLLWELHRVGYGRLITLFIATAGTSCHNPASQHRKCSHRIASLCPPRRGQGDFASDELLAQFACSPDAARLNVKRPIFKETTYLAYSDIGFTCSSARERHTGGSQCATFRRVEIAPSSAGEFAYRQRVVKLIFGFLEDHRGWHNTLLYYLTERGQSCIDANCFSFLHM